MGDVILPGGRFQVFVATSPVDFRKVMGSLAAVVQGGSASTSAAVFVFAHAVSPGAHAVVLMDRAGWHIARDLDIPANLTPVFLPAYSPELNAIERVWLYLRERFLSHRLWPSYDAILDTCCTGWNALLAETGRIRSLCTLDWAAPVIRANGPVLATLTGKLATKRQNRAPLVDKARSSGSSMRLSPQAAMRRA